ncbi:hypothetical protein VNO80_20495 [Phaseolus coccineus]|uniref:Alpha-carbonic anhydrase domain-containing protein n=1 Tax=Phaseolus coccineus TaxID=3886 RepID=A0AAN9M652_PHACN
MKMEKAKSFWDLSPLSVAWILLATGTGTATQSQRVSDFGVPKDWEILCFPQGWGICNHPKNVLIDVIGVRTVIEQRGLRVWAFSVIGPLTASATLEWSHSCNAMQVQKHKVLTLPIALQIFYNTTPHLIVFLLICIFAYLHCTKETKYSTVVINSS